MKREGGKFMFRKKPFLFLTILTIFLCLLLGGWLGGYVLAVRDNLVENIRLFNQVLSLVQTKYVEEVDTKKLIYSGIQGMLSSLDPHSQFLSPEEYRDLMVGTHGSFGGIGIQISIRDEWLTVISPIEGTPAYRLGLEAGDRIIKIEGASTKGITVEEAVKKLRGEPGTTVTITIEREGEPEPIDYTITRAKIEIESIPYWGMVKPHIAYVRLANFSEKSGSDLAKVIEQIEKENLKGLILDLRYNAGGLLNQAVEVANNFFSKGELIVSTRGRIPEANQVYKASEKSKHQEFPLVVLVNGGSASASEIVAGAIQDWDRGLILGTETFGKGSVQTVIQLSSNTGLKLTTAKYYTPSGRCIHKERMEAEPEEVEEKEETKPKEIFNTLGGLKRIVYGGGGITPDLILDLPKLTKLESDLERKALFFKFAVKYTATHKNLPRDFQVDEAMLNEFKRFLSEEKFEYEIKDFETSTEYVRKGIKREIINKLWGNKALYEIELKDDVQVQKAIELLSRAKDLKDLLKIGATSKAGK